EGGYFDIQAEQGRSTLIFSFIGYVSQEIEGDGQRDSLLKVYLVAHEISLASVEVLSTGFQEISAERATGSFSHLDNKLVTRRVSTNLLDRMEDLTPGLIFNRDRADLDKGENISIRGNISLLADNRPLIVLDNLAYDGPIESINPNDVESITVLKDAAAASIWGAKAGNGVIVITTKNGKFSSPLKVNFTSNSTLGKAFDPFYSPQMAVADFIDVEHRLFDQGYFDGEFNAFDQGKLSPVVESLFQSRNHEIPESELQNRLSKFKTGDIRAHLKEDFYRNSFNQQLALNVSGGMQSYRYFVGLGYDHNRESRVSEQSERITFSTRQNWASPNGRWNVGLHAYLSTSGDRSGFPDLEGLSPYDRLKDTSGNPLAVYKNYNVRFIESMRETELLNWDFVPMKEFNASETQNKLNEV